MQALSLNLLEWRGPRTTRFEIPSSTSGTHRTRRRLLRSCGARSPQGHPLYDRAVRVVARALQKDDVIVEFDDEVAVVHLTWAREPERLPWPLMTFLASARELESYAQSEFDL